MLKQLLVYCTSLLLVGSSCEYPDSIGLDLVEEEQFDMVFLDTATVKLSTVLFDSLPTSHTGRLLTGYHADPAFGTIEARAFFQVGLDSLNSFPDEDKAIYSRSSLVLNYDDYAYYDTTQLQTYYLYRVTEDMQYEEETYKLYNTSRFAYDSAAYLGMMSLYLRPHREGYVEIPLDDTLGRELFMLAQEQDDLIEDESDFLNRYKGFVLVPDPQNTMIVGFDSTSHIQVYYQEGVEEETLIFPIADQIYFTQLQQERSHTLFAPLQQQKYELPAVKTGDQAYVQGGIGIALRVEFPYLKSLLTLGQGVFITEAFLQLNPLKGTFGGMTPLPATLSVYQVDGLNRIIDTYDFAFTLYPDEEFKEDTYYSLPVANFLNTQLLTEENNEHALLIVLPEDTYYHTVDRMVVGGPSSEDPSVIELFLLKNYRRQ